MFASRWAVSCPARTAVVAVAVVVAADYCLDDGSWKNVAGDRLADSVAAPATVGNRCRSWSVAGRSMAAAAAAVPCPAVAGKTMTDRVALAGAADERPDPSPRVSCPTPPASRATCIVRNPGHKICPNLAPRGPEKYDAARIWLES